MSALSETIYRSKYSRMIWGASPVRREEWSESWDRTLDCIFAKASGTITSGEMADIRKACLDMDVSSSMRMFAMAGAAVNKNNICGYNCSYLACDAIDAFVEQLIISMCGTGTGYSVERRYVSQLPPVAPLAFDHAALIASHAGRVSPQQEHFTVQDTAEGWADAYRGILEACWLRGASVSWDSSLIRPKGAPIKGRGGRSSGPECFDRMVVAVLDILRAARGRQLRPIEAHDLMCHTARCAAQGDVRQAACIAIFDPDDEEMLHCKDSGQMDLTPGAERNAQRVMANNSAVWPDRELSIDEIDLLLRVTFDSMRGEPGLFSRFAARNSMPARRLRFDQTGDPIEHGPNPCVEIILRRMQFCNLSMAILRAGDSYGDIMRKVHHATILGTIQSMFANFPGLRPGWQANCEEERLLGVDLQGHFDRPLSSDQMRRLRAFAVEVNATWARRLGINPSAAITCGKPGGASHLLHGCAPGAANYRPFPYYIARVRLSPEDPVAHVLQDAGVPCQFCEITGKLAFEFPVASPPGVRTAAQVSAIEHLEEWRRLKEHWTEHNPSTTVYYREDERDGIVSWLHRHQRIAGGISFYPRSDARYALQPREQIEREEFERREREFPSIDWSMLREGPGDSTGASAERACVNGVCEL